MDAGIQFGYRMSKKHLSYFDKPAVMSAMDKTTRRVFSRFGAFVRQRDITMMLRSKPEKKFGVHSKVTDQGGSAKAGTPPAVHLGLIVKFVQFWYDTIAQSVIVGPERLNGRLAGGAALEALEYGGESLVLDHQKEIRVQIQPHPSINPAFEAELELLPPKWENAMEKMK